MKVDGLAFRKARKKIRAQFPGRGEPGFPAKGTQEWLADEARLSLRAVQYLERGEASQKTLEAVSKVLDLPRWEEYIYDFGAEHVTCSAKKVIDFRPEMYPFDHPDSFFKSSLMMSIDPLTILAESGKFKQVLLKEIKATLSIANTSIDFTWFAEVALNPAGSGWLGWVREMDEFHIVADDQFLHIPIMFRQVNLPLLSWGDFVKLVESTDNNQLDIDFTLCFSHFEKTFKVLISIELLQYFFSESRKKYNTEWPCRVQMKTVVAS